MEIVIGATAYVGRPAEKAVARNIGSIEAKVLNVRPPRRRQDRPPDGGSERRGEKNTHDPASGQVLTLLVSEGHNIPKDIESGNYRVFLRFVPRGR